MLAVAVKELMNLFLCQAELAVAVLEEHILL
jgi:hypothetical protein